LAPSVTMSARCVLLLVLLWTTAAGAQQPRVVFMEPVSAEPLAGELPVYAVVTDTVRRSRYASWMENDAARWASRLYRAALQVAHAEGGGASQPPELYLALVPGGNHAAAGFRLASPTDTVVHPGAAYVILGPQEWRFGITLLHEMGHVVLRVLRDGQALPQRTVASIPHTTAALTDRTTAFDEGLAIALEALVVHLSDEPPLANKYRHAQMLFGVWPGLLAEYYRASADLTSFSQTVARYYSVRENAYAFATAVTTPDYLRVQLERARDYSTLRGPNQLLQSEGFYASFFLSLLVRGKALPPFEVVEARQTALLRALARVVREEDLAADTPYLLRFISAHRAVRPDEQEDVLDVLLDLTHGVFIDPNATATWRAHYLGALRLDMTAVDREGIEARRAGWRRAALANPDTLGSLLGPQIPCTVPSVVVELPALQSAMPLSFDINTAQAGVLRLVPEITEGEVARWLEARDARPFEDRRDLGRRAGLSQRTLDAMTCEPGP